MYKPSRPSPHASNGTGSWDEQEKEVQPRQLTQRFLSYCHPWRGQAARWSGRSMAAPETWAAWVQTPALPLNSLCDLASDTTTSCLSLAVKQRVTALFSWVAMRIH